jgi:gliding motility-associated-like protein
MSVFASGGTTPLVYNNGGAGQASNVFTNQSAGIYLVTVTDSNACVDTQSHTILAPIPPTWNMVSADTVICFGDSTGTITLSTNVGTSSAILDSIIAPAQWIQQITGGTVSGLPAGTYTLRSTDGNNCSIDTVVTIASPTQMVWTSAVVDSVSCNGDSTGSITVVSTGGTGSNHTYSINPSVGVQAPVGTFNNLNAQTFTVTALDSNNCVLDTMLSVLEPAVLSVDTLSVTDVACHGDSSGVIVLTSTGGTPVVTYAINPNLGVQAPSGTISNLPWGTYTITGTDGNSCTATTLVTITQAPLFSITSTVVDSVACHGDTTGSVTITLGGGTPQYSCTIAPNVGSQSTPGNFTGLPAGLYTITCLDANNCLVSTSVTIYEPTALSYTSVTSTDVSCNGANDGSVVAVGTGGSGILSYNLTPPPSSQGPNGTFTLLNGGNKTITVVDGNNCTLDSVVTIVEPNVLSISPSGTTAINCNGDTTGLISMMSTGGTTPVTYTISPVATQSFPGIFSGLGAGTYIITGTDSNNCVALDTVILSEPSLLVIDSVVSTIPTCVPGGDATMTIYASGGTPPYLYTNGLIPTPGPDSVFMNQSAGSYNIEVVDNLGCLDTTTHIISTPGAPSWNTIVSTPVLCNGDANGTITLTTTGGSGAITYTISGATNPPSNTTGIFNNLLAGNYTLTAVDTNNCSITSSVMVGTPAALSYASASIDSVDCNGNSTGSITVVGAGGVTPYSYQITLPAPPSASNATGNFMSLAADTYTVTMTDSNNCMHDTILTVSEPVVLAINTSTTTNILCNGDSTGVIWMVHTGGTGSVNYTISPDPNGVGSISPGNFGSLPADTYTITGTDANNCTATWQVTLTEPTALVIDSIVSTLPSCVPGNDATMTVYASGGNNTSYTYNNGTLVQLNNNVFGNQGAATYPITVTDANACSVTSTHTIAIPGSPTWDTVTHVDVLCNGDSTGSISAVVIPGNNPTITTTIILPIAYNATALPATNLPAGQYTIQAVDANGCSITSLVDIMQPNPLVITTAQVDSVLCNGDSTGGITLTMMGGNPTYSYSINTVPVQTNTTGAFTGLPQGIYTITISDANNCTVSTTLQVQEPTALQYTSVSSTNVSCNGADNGTITTTATGGTGLLTFAVNPLPAIQLTSGNFTGLNGGMKTLTVSDANGCTLDSVITIIEPSLFTIDTISAQMVLCFGDSSGQLVMSSMGGTTVNPVTYTITPANGTQGPNGTFSNLPWGTYTITATDNNGCTAVQIYTITQPMSAVVITNVSGVPPSCVPGNDGSITITANGGTPVLEYSLDNITYQPSNVFSNLGASGNYIVYVRDGNGCTTVDSITLTTPGAPAWTSVSSTLTTCNGDSTGSITGVASGASAITYTLTPLNGGVQGPAGTFSNLPWGNYTISASDANGCSVISAINVNQPDAIEFTSVLTDSVDCNGGMDGSIVLMSQGGTGSLTYSINPLSVQAPVGTFAGLSAATYTVTITDSNLCTVDSMIVVSEPAAVSLDTLSQLNVLCRGDSSGQLVMTSGGGTGTITYSIAPVAGTQFPSGTFSNLPADVYTITATDGNLCTAVSTYTISEPIDNVLISGISGTTPSCNPGSDGTVTVTAAGGTGGLTYTLSPTVIIPQGPNFSGLVSGTYLVTAIDANACTDTMSYTLGVSPLPVWNTVNSTDALCNGDSSGTISVTTTGGTTPISYSIIAPTSFIQTNASGNFMTLPADTYTIQVSDSNNCTIDTMVTIGEPTALSFASVQTDSVSCNGLTDGQITVVGAGGTTPYTYQITLPAPPSASNGTGIFTGWAANTYTIELTDSNNCSASTQAIIYEPTPVVIDSASSIDVLCNGDSTGSIYIASSGGTPSLYHIIGTDTNQSNPSFFTNYPAGMYTVTSVDGNGCSVTTMVTVNEPTPLTHTITSTDVLCFGDATGTITIIGSGGVGGYSYELYNPFQTSGTGQFTGLSAGTYTGVVIDANGCRDTTAVDTIFQPTQIVLSAPTIQNIDCFGDSTGSIGIGATDGTGAKTLTLAGPVNDPIGQPSPANFQNLPAGIYIITATDANACTVTTLVTLTQNPELFFSSITNTEETCFGDSTAVISFQGAGGVSPYTYVFGGVLPASTQTTYSGLTTGTYNIELIDDLGCRADTNYTLDGPEEINFSEFEITPTTCLDTEDGKLNVTARGGRGGRYTYSLEPGFIVNTNGAFRDLAPRTYVLRTSDTAGCFIDTTVVIPLPSNPMVVTLTKDDLGCHGIGNEGRARAEVGGGTPPYTYLWSSTPAQTSSEAVGLYQGLYTVDVVDGNGCLVRDTLVIEPGPCCQEVFLPNAFSPNGDGRNDEFRALSTAGIELEQFEVYNRWGIRVWQTNNMRSGWNGEYDGERAATGTFYYVFRYRCLTDGQTYTMKGDVVLVR